MSQEKGSGWKRNRGNRQRVNLGDPGRKVLENISEDNPIIQQFRSYSAELDAKHDRTEQVIKLGRDVVIESKRVIFLLHTLYKQSSKTDILEEAKSRLDKIKKNLFRNIAKEVAGQDCYQFLKAYRNGIQEYVEALTFLQYVQSNHIKDWSDVQLSLTFDLSDDTKYSLEIPPNEFILGVADLTGELMRMCINNLASGDIPSCYSTCRYVREIYKGFLGVGGICGKEANKKVYTLKQSLTKMENVCYAIKVRGSEIPKHMLADFAIMAGEDYPAEENEGYQVY